MIIASDLDRTLIYSKRALEDYGCPAGTILKPVESREGQWVSYMTERSFFLLKEICRQYLFVPITTRTTNQFRRITIFAQEIPLSYVITANGAIILKNGKPLHEWAESISSKMKTGSAGIREVMSRLDKEGFQMDGKIKQVEDLFFYYILLSPLAAGEKQMLSNLVSSIGWNVSLQGRKLYFIPKAINKGDALEFICNMNGAEAIAGAGDSSLDWDFLNRCRSPIVPNHGELAQEASNGFRITKQSGLFAGEEILESYLSL